MRTGAFRWRLYRHFEDPRRMTEAFSLGSWDEHVRQHQRIDAVDAEIIRWARDRSTWPTGRGPGTWWGSRWWTPGTAPTGSS